MAFKLKPHSGAASNPLHHLGIYLQNESLLMGSLCSEESFIRLRMSYLHYRLRLSLPNYASSCLFFPQVLALHHSLEAFFHLKLLLSLGAFIGITPQINLLHLLYFRIGFPRGLNIKKS